MTSICLIVSRFAGTDPQHDAKEIAIDDPPPPPPGRRAARGCVFDIVRCLTRDVDSSGRTTELRLSPLHAPHQVADSVAGDAFAGRLLNTVIVDFASMKGRVRLVALTTTVFNSAALT